MRQPDVQIESDASLSGWGVSAHGSQTGGPWSREEETLHINCLELLAATLAVKTFLNNQVNKKVLMLLDNQTAVAYVTTWAEQSPPMRQGWPDNCECGSLRDTFC